MLFRSGPPVRLFTYAPSRSAKTALELYAGATGALVSDGYEAYAAVARAGPLTHLGCWAHVRRRFGGDIARHTLAHSVIRVGAAVQPLINLLRDRLLEAPVIHGDETELQVLKEDGRAATTKSYLWLQMTATGPPVRLFA